jgi:hypothetical protein
MKACIIGTCKITGNAGPLYDANIVITRIEDIHSAEPVDGHTIRNIEERIGADAIVATTLCSRRASACHSDDGPIRKDGSNFVITAICDVHSTEHVQETPAAEEERI